MWFAPKSIGGGTMHRDQLPVQDIVLSRCGSSLPGKRWRSWNGMLRLPFGPLDLDGSADHGQGNAHVRGWTAMQSSLAPRMAWIRLTPPMAEQPAPRSLVAGR